MIEIVYNKEKESAVGNEEYFCVPRNIRQVGQPSQHCKIYMEDYAYGYLESVWKERQEKGQMAILLGKSNWKDGVFYIFLKSAILIENMELSEEYLAVKDEIWGGIYEEMKTFFPGQEVVGWHLALPGGALKVTEIMKKIHLNHFGGNDKVLYLTDLSELDNAFFVYRNGRMERQPGYYIYYEKNEEMQEYVLEKHPKASVDYTGQPQDRAVHDFRKIIERKRKEREVKRWDGVLGLLTAGAAVAVAVLGVIWLQQTVMNRNQMAAGVEELQGTVEEASTEERQEAMEEVSVEEMQETVEEAAVEEIQETIEEVSVEGIEGAAESIYGNERTETETSAASEQGLQIEEDSQEMSEETSVNTGNFQVYTICLGDTLSGISLRYYGNMEKIEEICRMNGLNKEDLIYPGQKILLP